MELGLGREPKQRVLVPGVASSHGMRQVEWVYAAEVRDAFEEPIQRLCVLLGCPEGGARPAPKSWLRQLGDGLAALGRLPASLRGRLGRCLEGAPRRPSVDLLEELHAHGLCLSPSTELPPGLAERISEVLGVPVHVTESAAPGREGAIPSGDPERWLEPRSEGVGA